MEREEATKRRSVPHPSGGRTLVKQSQAAETDVNQIMARWITHGQPPRGNGRPPEYGDFSNGMDFTTAINQVRQAEQDFAELPAQVRKACRNSPALFLELVHDPDRQAELVKLGLATDRIPETATPPTPPSPAPDPSPVP